VVIADNFFQNYFQLLESIYFQMDLVIVCVLLCVLLGLLYVWLGMDWLIDCRADNLMADNFMLFFISYNQLDRFSCLIITKTVSHFNPPLQIIILSLNFNHFIPVVLTVNDYLMTGMHQVVMAHLMLTRSSHYQNRQLLYFDDSLAWVVAESLLLGKKFNP
jgi:hypothetical protein